MATFHSGSEGQTQKLQALRRRQKYLAFRAVIVPPVCWGICAASAPWWFPPLKEMLGVRFDAQTQGWMLLVLILLGAIAYVSIVLMVCWKETHVAAPGKDYEAMLVLGAQVKPDGTASLQLQWRLEKAAETYRQKKVPVVVCGGQGGNEPAPEAVVMRDVLIGLGVDEDMILMDTTSASTHSNIKNAMQLLGGRNVTKVMIITSDYHLPRAIAIAEDNGLTAYGIGAPTKLGLRFWLKNHCREALAWCKYWAVKYTHLPLE